MTRLVATTGYGTGIGLLVAALLLVGLGAPGVAEADPITCPKLGTLTYGITTPLPDPWFSTNQGTTDEPMSRGVLVKGKEMIVCDYDTDKKHWNHVTLSVLRPVIVNAPWAEIPCPASRVQVGLLTSVPAPWHGVTYTLDFDDKHRIEIADYAYVRCRYRAYVPAPYVGPSSIVRPLVLDYPDLAPTPKHGPGTTLANPFGVQVSLQALPAQYTGACPVSVRFHGTITASGPGQVKYRFVTNKGAKGPVGTLDFAAAGTRNVSTEVVVGPTPGGPGVLAPGARPGSTPAGTFTMVPGAPGLGGLQQRPGATPVPAGGAVATPTVPNKHWGSLRIEIVEPGHGTSNEAVYSVLCQKSSGGPGGLATGAGKPGAGK
jgi:hypothetical protein